MQWVIPIGQPPFQPINWGMLKPSLSLLEFRILICRGIFFKPSLSRRQQDTCHNAHTLAFYTCALLLASLLFGPIALQCITWECVGVCACVYMCVLEGIRILFSLLMCVCCPKRARRTNGTMLHHLPWMIKPCYWPRGEESQSSSSCLCVCVSEKEIDGRAS